MNNLLRQIRNAVRQLRNNNSDDFQTLTESVYELPNAFETGMLTGILAAFLVGLMCK